MPYSVAPGGCQKCFSAVAWSWGKGDVGTSPLPSPAHHHYTTLRHYGLAPGFPALVKVDRQVREELLLNWCLWRRLVEDVRAEVGESCRRNGSVGAAVGSCGLTLAAASSSLPSPLPAVPLQGCEPNNPGLGTRAVPGKLRCCFPTAPTPRLT